MKKIFLSLLISLIVFTNIITPVSVFAAAPTITFQFGQDSGHTSDNLRAWYFILNTTGIPDGDEVKLTFSANGVDVTPGYISTKININTGSYNTGFILQPATTYKITATAPGVIASFERLTLGTSTTSPPNTDTTTPYFFISSIDNGVKGLPTGYKDLTTCNTARDVFMSGFSDTTKSTMGQCYQMTVADAQSKENARLSTPVGGPVQVDAVNSSTNSSTYTLLAPLPGLKPCLDWNSDPTKKDPSCMGANIGDYLNVIFKLLIGISAALAVIMLIINGIMYMGEESVFGKVEAKSKMFSAILGLIIAIGAWALLNTINPALTGAGGFSISAATAAIAGDTDSPIAGINVLPSGIICSGGRTNIPNIVQSFSRKMTYQMGAKGVAGPNNTILLDCSGFVDYVLKCANVSFVNGGTASIFSGAEPVTSINGDTVNGKTLQIGDLIGWKAGENSEKFGHVMIYIGNGQVQVGDSHGGTTVGNALGIFSITQYQNRIKYIKRAV